MEFNLRHIGSFGGNPASILELEITGENISFTENVANFTDNKVNDDLINSLIELAVELKEHNNKIDELISK